MRTSVCPLLVSVLLISNVCAQTAQVRHAPALNGTVEGSLQQMTAESTTLNGNASVTGDLLVPGTPSVQLNGNPVYSGTVDGAGAATPTNHKVTLNGSASLRHVIRRTDAVTLPTVAAPPAPTGSVTVVATTAGQSVNWSTARDVTLNSGVGNQAVPAGAYGDFTANAGSSFTLGVAGATTPAVYSFQHLTLNGNSTLAVVGPVVVTLANGMSANGNLGNSAHPEWFTLKFTSGGLALSGNASAYGYVTAPSGPVTISGNAQLVGGLVADQLTINGHGRLRLLAPPPANGLPFLANFEPAEGYTLGPINGQNGWTASSPSIVTDADFASGARSVLVPGQEPPLTLSRAFDPHPGQAVVFVDLFALPQAAADDAASMKLLTLNSAQVAFVRSGATGRFEVFAGDGAGGGSWQATPASIPVDAAGYATAWVRVTLRLDYPAKKWDLYVGGVMTAADAGFAQNTQTGLGSFTLTGQAAAPTLLDDFLAAFDNPLFVDADKDGMEDAWETAHGLNPALDDRAGDPDADGLTNIQEYVLGTKPNNTDSDTDDLPDKWEHQYGLNPILNDAGSDLDSDGVSNFIEFKQGRNPTKGAVPDTTGVINLRVFQPGN